MSVPGTKKSWVNWVPGLPSFERSVITDALFSRSVAACDPLAPFVDPATPRAKNPRHPRRPDQPHPCRRPCHRTSGWSCVVVLFVVVGAIVRVTMMSVPTVPSGERTRFCASDRPWDTPTMPITRPTPAASPRAVTSVRVQRRRSSFSA